MMVCILNSLLHMRSSLIYANFGLLSSVQRLFLSLLITFFTGTLFAVPNSMSVSGNERASAELPIRKFDLPGDQKRLSIGFELNQRSGTESGGGGSLDRELFYFPMRKAMAILKREDVFHFHDGQKIEVSRLENALRVATIIPTKKQLYDSENVKVDLKNDSDDLVIWFNVPAWVQMSQSKQIRFGLHEALGLLKIPDPLYKYSAQLEKFVIENDQVASPLPEIQKQSVPRKSVFEFLQQANSSNENIVLSSKCERYEPSHKSFCLIKTVMENGFMRQLIYLVEGTVDEFHGNATGETQVATVRTILNIPASQVQFVLSLIRVDMGKAEVLNKSDCHSRGFAEEAQVDDGHLCVIARFPLQNIGKGD